MEEALLKIYTDPSNPGAFGGQEKLYKAAIKAGLPVTRQLVEKFLSSVLSYSLTKPKRRKFKRARVVAVAINDVHMADLADLSYLAEFNDGYKYWLLIIDFFRKYVWVQLIKTKTAAGTATAFANVYADEGNRCRYLQTDYGGEFYGAPTRRLFKKLKIKHYSIPNREVKASAAERAIRTIKGLCMRYMLHNLTRRYIDALPAILVNYNNTKSRVTGFAPAAIDAANSDQVFRNMYPELWEAPPDKSPKPSFAVGDSVRLADEKKQFQKGYSIGWTPEVFRIRSTSGKGTPLRYTVEDQDSKEVKGTFYKEELAKVTKPDNVYLVESVIDQRRTREGKRQFLVRWLGFREPSWVPEEDLIRGQEVDQGDSDGSEEL